MTWVAEGLLFIICLIHAFQLETHSFKHINHDSVIPSTQ